MCASASFYLSNSKEICKAREICVFLKKKLSLVRPEIERGVSRFLLIMLHDAAAMNNLALHLR